MLAASVRRGAIFDREACKASPKRREGDQSRRMEESMGGEVVRGQQRLSLLLQDPSRSRASSCTITTNPPPHFLTHGRGEAVHAPPFRGGDPDQSHQRHGIRVIALDTVDNSVEKQ